MNPPPLVHLRLTYICTRLVCYYAHGGHPMKKGVGTRMHTLTTLEQETVRESKKCPLVDEIASTR